MGHDFVRIEPKFKSEDPLTEPYEFVKFEPKCEVESPANEPYENQSENPSEIPTENPTEILPEISADIQAEIQTEAKSEISVPIRVQLKRGANKSLLILGNIPEGLTNDFLSKEKIKNIAKKVVPEFAKARAKTANNKPNELTVQVPFTDSYFDCQPKSSMSDEIV